MDISEQHHDNSQGPLGKHSYDGYLLADLRSASSSGISTDKKDTPVSDGIGEWQPG